MENKAKSILPLDGALKLTLLFFGIAALFGFVLRLAFSANLPEWISYSNIRHAHSHVALLGWLHAAFLLCIILVWKCSWKRYMWLFIAMQACVLGMALTFPLTGYAFGSIAFTTTHIILSYVIIGMIWRDTTKTSGFSLWFLRSAFIFLFVATLGTWLMGPIMVNAKGSALYYASIQWYLHFMFNGWLIFSMLAVMFKFIENLGISYSNRDCKVFFYLLTGATILTYALAVTWSTPIPAIFYLNSFGVMLQLLAFYYFLKIIIDIAPKVKPIIDQSTYRLIFISLSAFGLKVIIQAAVVIPVIAKVSYTIKNFVIGFIHLLMLGCLSLFILAFILQEVKGTINHQGIKLLILGILGTEILLFIQGLLFWMGMGFIFEYHDFMTLFSFVLLIGVWWIALSFKVNQKMEHRNI